MKTGILDSKRLSFWRKIKSFFGALSLPPATQGGVMALPVYPQHALACDIGTKQKRTDLEKLKKCLDDIGVEYDVYPNEDSGRLNLVSENNYCDKIDVCFRSDGSKKNKHKTNTK